MSDQSRMACWQVTRWATDLDIKRIIIENVPEFQTYGPLDMRTGRPLKSKKGVYFHAFLDSLRAIGYTVDYKVLCTADYGDVTTRDRLFIMARKDGRPIVWPTPTHSKEGGENLFGSTQKWRAAKEIINWNDEGKSIFGRKKPLAQKTLTRIYAGAMKFQWPEPFLVILRNHMNAQSVHSPLPTITATGTHIALATTHLKDMDLQAFVVNPESCHRHNSEEETSINEPLPSDAKDPSYIVEATLKPFILNRHGENGSVRCHDADNPIPTVTCRGAGYVLEPKAQQLSKDHDRLKAFLLSQQSGGSPRDTEEPLMTIAGAGAISMTKPVLFEVNHSDGENTARPPLNIDKPLPALTTKRNIAIASPLVVNMKGNSTAGSTDKPIPTITTIQNLALANPFISAFYGDKNGKPRVPHCIDEPLPTQGTANRFGLIKGSAKPFIIPQFGERKDQIPRTHDTDMPLPTVTSHGAGALVEPLLVQTDQTGSNGCCIRSTKSPLPTILTRINQAVVTPTVNGEDDMPGIPVQIDGKIYLLDITFRMLSNPELAKAMGFSDEETEYEFVGTKSDVTKQIGNAVPVHTACALVSALCGDVSTKQVQAAA